MARIILPATWVLAGWELQLLMEEVDLFLDIFDKVCGATSPGEAALRIRDASFRTIIKPVFRNELVVISIVFNVICSDSFKLMRFPSKLLPSPVHFARGGSILGGTLRGGVVSYSHFP